MLKYNLPEMTIQQFVWDVIDSNSFLLTEGRYGLLIDAVASAELIERLAELDDLLVILTHCHFDHICGLNQIRERKPRTMVCASRKCSEKIGNQFKNLSSTGDTFWAFYKNKKLHDEQQKATNESLRIIEPFVCAPADQVFEGKTQFNWQGHTVQLMQCSGHTDDSLIAVLDEQYLFSGDTLLAIPTVTRFPTGSTAQFWKETIPRLKTLPAEVVFPGHGAPGHLEDMIAINKEPERYKAK